MGIARTHAVALIGLTGTLVEVEADISAQLPGMILIGLPDAALSQATQRVRAAAANSGCPLTVHRLTINLSPAALPKHGAGFDLAIALACLAADKIVSAESVGSVVHFGELALDGRVRPTPGILPGVMAAARLGYSTVMVPIGNEPEAQLVPGIRVVGVASLREAAIWHGAALTPVEVEPILAAILPTSDVAEPDLADVIGNDDAILALQIAAAGGHHVFLLGPPGAGKTMLAARLPSLLPDLDPASSLEVSSIRSLTGIGLGGALITRPPWEAPHHTATAAAMVGGGGSLIRPGAASQASHGVLFLDEAPEFGSSVLDALRQPLESGMISIHRANAVAHFPARFQLVMAANPCPCGQYGAGDLSCTCPPNARRRYLARISGPLLDRIDIQLSVKRITAAQLRLAAGSARMTSASARQRVVAARAVAAERLTATPWTVNSEVPGPWLRAAPARLSPATTAGLDRALERGGITMRGYDRVLRIAWTLADYEGLTVPGPDQLGQALYLRKGMSS